MDREPEGGPSAIARAKKIGCILSKENQAVILSEEKHAVILSEDWRAFCAKRSRRTCVFVADFFKELLTRDTRLFWLRLDVGNVDREPGIRAAARTT
jgi:hypothetical protein